MSNEYSEEERQTNRLAGIEGELEDLNSHFLAYLEVMALTLLNPCGPTSSEADKQAREATALKLLKHVEESK